MPELAAAVFEGHLQVHIPVDSCGIKSHSCSKTELAGILAGLFMCLDPSRLRDLLFSKLEGAWQEVSDAISTLLPTKIQKLV